MPQGTTYYNSDDPSTDDGGPIASMMGAMIDQPFTMVISSEGETKSVKGLAEIVDHAIEQMSGLGEEAKEAMKAQFGGEAMTRNLKSITAFFPPNPVKIGESWENEQTVANGGMELIVNSLYTFVGREDGLARIQVEGDILTNPDADAMEIMGMTFEYNLQGTQMGYILVDENTGVAVHSAITQAFMGNMTTDTPETGPMNLSLVVDNTIDIQLQEDQP